MIFGGFTPSTLIDYPGYVAAVVFTIGCNFRCPYCHNPELVDETVSDRWPEDAIIEKLEKRATLLDGVVITGGEPTMHGDDLLVFMRRVKALGLRIKLDTNGTNPDMLAQAYKENLLDYVAMDIKGPLDTYYAVTLRPVDINAIRKSITLIMESSVSYEFRTTVIKTLTSPDDIENIAREIQGAEAYYLQKFIPTKILNPQFKRKVTYSVEDFEVLKKRAEPYVVTCGIR